MHGIKYPVWKLKSEDAKDLGLIDTLLANRGIESSSEKKDFLETKDPKELRLTDLGVKDSTIKKVIDRVKRAIKNKEKVIVFGDYDADGVTATAIIWEALHHLGVDALPYIPSRFTEGYGLSFESVTELKEKYPNLSLVITVDNGIVAKDAVEKINKLGIDVIITDHHAIDGTLPRAFAIVHSQMVGGAAVSWFTAKELCKAIGGEEHKQSLLELAAIGTIADQLPLLGINRSLVKYGLKDLQKTTRVGVIELTKLVGSDLGSIGTYEVNYGIVPRLNAMGRMGHAMDSLRVLCTRDVARARELVELLEKTNKERQASVETIYVNAKVEASKQEGKVIVIADTTYHEGVIGLIASRLTEEYRKPAIVISKGEVVSKASARSVPGFDITTAIKSLGDVIEGGGGHPMAAGFSIKTKKIEEFSIKFNELAKELLPAEEGVRTLEIDSEIDFADITWDLAEKIKAFEPNGSGNPIPVFMTNEVEILDVKPVGKESKHLKLKLKKGETYLDGIAFGFGEHIEKIAKAKVADIAFLVDVNIWNGASSIQLKARDIHLLQ